MTSSIFWELFTNIESFLEQEENLFTSLEKVLASRLIDSFSHVNFDHLYSNYKIANFLVRVAQVLIIFECPDPE